MVGEIWQIGDVRITRVVEIEATGGMSRIIPDAKRELVREIEWLYPHFCDADGRMRGAIHALIVDTPHTNKNEDTCIGNDKERAYPRWNKMQGDYLEKLTTAGFSTEQFDTVLCTHMHVDHVGWNTRLINNQWVPTFMRVTHIATTRWMPTLRLVIYRH